MSNTSLINKHVFEEHLIKKIRNHACLYNKKVAEYKDKSSRDKAWKEVSEALGQSEKVCKLRWKSLRDRYVREVNETKPSGVYWHFYDLLSFLDDHIVSKSSRKRDSKIRIKQEKINNDDSNDNISQLMNDPMYEECNVDPLPNLNDNNYCNENIDVNDEEIIDHKQLQPQVIIPIYQETNQTPSFSSGVRIAKRKSQRLRKDNVPYKKKSTNENKIDDDIQQRNDDDDDNENKILRFLDKFNEIIDKRLTEITIRKDNVSQQHRPFFKMLENYLDKIDETQHDDFKLEILNYVNERCREYYN